MSKDQTTEPSHIELSYINPFDLEATINSRYFEVRQTRQLPKSVCIEFAFETESKIGSKTLDKSVKLTVHVHNVNSEREMK